MTFGEKIKAYRRLKGITQIELCGILGITQQSVVYMEKKVFVKPNTQKKIEEKLKFKLDTLIDEKSRMQVKDAEYYLKQAAIYKEQYEHCLKMAELVQEAV